MPRERPANGPTEILEAAQLEEFASNGMLLLKGFYDLATEIEPIQRGIHCIIGMMIEKNRLAIDQPRFSPHTFDAGFQQLIAANRAFGGEVYDAVKQLPAFVRLAASAKHDAIMAQLRRTDLPGVAAGGYGIRIDNPREDKFRANWHQEYPAQLRSIDGLVFWSSLVPITEEMGPVQICVGSHRDGLVQVHTRDPRNPEKTGAYALTLADEETRVARYRKIQILSGPGDLLVMDFLTLHASGHNRSARSRWSMQTRYFNYRNPKGIEIGWRGSFAAGEDLAKIHPELIVN